jgi:hypothetical protein
MKTTSLWILLTMAALAVAAPAASDAKPQATCKAMCQRLTDCKLSGYTKMCLDSCKQYGYETSEQGRAQLLALTRYTCKQIQSALGATDAHQHQHASPRTSAPPSSAPPSSAPRTSSARRPSNPYDDDDFDYDDERDSVGADRGRGGGGGYNGGRGDSYGGRNAGNSGSDSGSGQWSCRAVGSYAPPGYDGGPDYSDAQNVDVTKWGRTRDEAGIAAIDDCSGMLNLSANTAIRPGSLVLQYCKVISCSR